MMFFSLDEFIAGWTGGILSLLVGHPLDTVKVRQQTLGGIGLYTAVRRTFKYEGIQGFYKGMLFPLLTIGPSTAIFFGVYGNAMKQFEQNEIPQHEISVDNIPAIQRVFFAGTFAGFIQVLFASPVELIKTTLQAQVGQRGSWKEHYEVPYKGSLNALIGITRDRGIRGLYKGLVPLMIRDVPTYGIYVLTYEMLLYSKFSTCDTPIPIKQMCAGGAAGIMSWLFVMPIDVVKSRIQADNPSNPKYKGTIDCFRKTYQHGGHKIFFRGLPAIIIRAFPVNAATFAGYEMVLKYLKN